MLFGNLRRVFGDEKPKGYPDDVRKIEYLSSADHTKQPALFYAPESEAEPAPLLVALHTWSGDYLQGGGEIVYAHWCLQQNWVFVHPHFRGPNQQPEAMGSDLMVADILDAVDYARGHAKVDPDRIYCVGVSGGGHASQLMAGRAPDLWAGVSAWCGISDIAAWHEYHAAIRKQSKYVLNIEAALGGDPTTDPARMEDALHRSPVSWLSQARGVNLDINHGVNDGRDGSVPFVHSLHAWNAVVPEPDRLPEEWIQAFYETRTPPPLSKDTPQLAPLDDPLYFDKPPVFRAVSGNTRLTIFKGRHEIIHEAALNWLAAQRKGQPAVWKVEKVGDLSEFRQATDSGN